MLKYILTASLLALFAHSAAAQDVPGNCTTSGSIKFDNFEVARDLIKPSIHRQISGIGRFAAANGCSLTVTCVAPVDADEKAIRRRDRQCRAAAQTLVWYESRPRVRRALEAEIEQNKIVQSNGFDTRAVYITLE